jgi:hypothetical protein
VRPRFQGIHLVLQRDQLLLLQGVQQLFHKEGIALGALVDQRFEGYRGVVGSEGVADERVRVLVGKWLYC